MAIKKNIAETEKHIRCWIGISVTVLAIFLGNPVLLLIGILLITTAKYGWCPFYAVAKKLNGN